MTELVYCVVFLAMFLTLAIVCCICLDRFHEFMWSWRNPPEKLAAERRELERRLLNPDWKFYEEHLQRPVPTALRELFAKHDLILGRQYVEYVSVDAEDCPRSISEFFPLDEQGLHQAREYGMNINAIPFAYSELGDLLYLRPGAFETNAVFSFWDELGVEGESEVAPNVETFVRNLRPCTTEM